MNALANYYILIDSERQTLGDVGHHERLWWIGPIAILIAAGCLAAVAIRAGGAPPQPSASIGVEVHRRLPRSVANLQLRDQDGRPVRLTQLRGRVVFLVPFLTSCQEECPITTGALLAMHDAIHHDGLGRYVTLVEVTVDPARDTPARLATYARLTGSWWPLLTGSGPTLARLWGYLGVYYHRVPEGSPPGIDWQTHRPYTYDVDHSDGFILLSPDLEERFVAGGMAKVTTLAPELQRLLDGQGREDLAHSGGGSWTVEQGLGAIGWLLGRAIPDAT